MKGRISGTNVNTCSGKPRHRSLESVDRISVLPDSILGIILSFLPTKNAVSTSLLSKRWKLVWTTIHNLDLCYEGTSRGEQDDIDMRFVEFVNRVLHHHDAGRIDKFRLVWTPRCISSHATSWIKTAISKNVHELSLRLVTYNIDSIIDGESLKPFVMPICLFNCNTLRFLELNGSISISDSVVFCLPKLETIKLDSVYFQSEEAFEKLIRGCPVLINLFISISADILIDFRQDVDFTYIISSASLRRLEILNEYDTDDEAFYMNLEIEGSSLEYLTLVGVKLIPVFSVQESLSSLVEATFDVYLSESIFFNADICNSVVEAVRVLDCAKALILTSSIIWALNCATISLSTEFKSLVKLDAETYCCACSSLRDLIQCSDNLQLLTIHQDPMDEVDEDDEDDEDEEDEEDEEDDDHSNWSTMVEAPRCLSTSLKKVVLGRYTGNGDEHEMICYLLKHGSVLKVMEIYCDSSFEDDKLDLVEEIRDCPRKSPGCEVKITRSVF